MTRGELIERLRRWAKRSNFDDLPYDDFFDDAYQVISREINPVDLDKWTELGGSGEPTTETNVTGQIWQYDIPFDMLDVFHVTNNHDRLRALRSDALMKDYAGRPDGDGSISYRPAYYAVVGRAIWIAPGAKSVLRIGYVQRDAQALSESSENFGMLHYPDAYAQLMLAGLYAYAERTEEETKAIARYAEIRDRINDEAGAIRMGAGARIPNW